MTLSPPPAVVVHRRPAEGAADHLLAFERAMLWLRLLGVGAVVTQSPLYRMVHPALLALIVVVVAAVAAVQGRLLAPGLSATSLRRRATALLVADLVSTYAIGTLFAPDQRWMIYDFYPLMSLEATLVAGAWAGASVTGLSIVVYLAQLVLHVDYGNAVEPRSIAAAISLIVLTGGFITLYAHIAGRGQEQLRTLLNLTSALTGHERQGDAIRHLDRRLHEAIGARVRSVAVLEPDGRYRVTRWLPGEDRVLTREQLLRAFGDVEGISRRLEAGDAVSIETDAWSLITASLGLPEWTASVTLVPITAEGRCVGILPVLWPSRTIPDKEQLRLLHGLAGQVGLALARGELEQMRREATVDPLTGLLNRRAIGAELQAFVARAGRSGGRLAVLLLEFEQSAAPGTGAGETSFRSVALAIRGALRNGDVAGRQDDDRLLVLAADADAEAARSLAVRIHARIASVPGAAALQFSLGIASFPDDGSTASDLVEAADARLGSAAPREAAHGFLRAAGHADDAAADDVAAVADVADGADRVDEGAVA